MAVRINPTRMELKRVKERLKTAVRGHKLLKDKSEEMIRQFTALIKKNKALREELEGAISASLKKFMLAKSLTDEKKLAQAIALPAVKYQINGDKKSIMNVMVPQMEIIKTEGESVFPYGFAGITGELNEAIKAITDLLPKMIELAEVEKACEMLAEEIQKNKRRVNALEYFMIPQMQETIRYIVMKLDENDRANLIRLMKVKELIEKRNAREG
jgi:V/A-type H+-transporting ATPase subunit D